LTIVSGSGHWLGHSDGRRTGPFATLPDLVLHRLAFTEFFKGHALDLRVVKEQVVPSTFDEPKTSIRNQLLDLTLWHLCPPLKKRKRWPNGLYLPKQAADPDNSGADFHRT
jgi:hypothetical protein